MTFDPFSKGVNFLNPAAVTTPASGTFGNCQVGAFDGPGYKSADLIIAKDFVRDLNQVVVLAARTFAE
jgi:hypothetical protein